MDQVNTSSGRRRTGVLASLIIVAVVVAQGLAVMSARAATGDLSTAAGSLGTGTATAIGMYARGLAVRGTNLYVSDVLYGVVRKVDLTTGTATVVAGNGISG